MHITEIGSISSSIMGEGSKNVTEIRGSFRFEVAAGCMYADRIYNQRQGKHDPYIFPIPIPFPLPPYPKGSQNQDFASKLTTSCIRLVHRFCLKERFAIESDVQGDTFTPWKDDLSTVHC